MWRLWAVARHTIRQCLRMKVAALFMVLLIAAMILTSLTKGDETLAGKIQSFLHGSTFWTAGLLGLMTIFLTTAIVSGDVRSHQIFSIATKPVARWQYVIGRWLGVALLNAALVTVAGVAIYGLAQYLRAGQAHQTASGRADDRRKIETEIFTARLRISPDQTLDVDKAVDDRIKQLKAEGHYKQKLQAFIDTNNGNKKAGEAHLRRELKIQVLDRFQKAGPGQMIAWNFSGARVAGKEVRKPGTVESVKSGPDGRGRLVFRAGRAIVGKLIYEGPVWVNDVVGRVVWIAPRRFAAVFSADDMVMGPIATLKKGGQVKIAADPTIQITYKATGNRGTAGGTLPSFWEIENPSDNWLYYLSRKDAAKVPATLTVPARVVDKKGRTSVRYVNMTKGNTVTIKQDDVAVLYRVGSFGPNLARGMTVIFVQLAFLAALGVLAGSFASFPVASLLCFSVLPFQIARNFLLDAVSPPVSKGNPGILVYLNQYIIRAMDKLLPDFGSAFPARSLVDGTYISWQFLGQTVFWTLCVQTVILLVLACVIFRNRELARVQV